MKPMIFERTIAAQVDWVWAVVTDIERYTERFAAVDAAVLLTRGSSGVSTRWRETRTVYGRSATVETALPKLKRYTGTLSKLA